MMQGRWGALSLGGYVASAGGDRILCKCYTGHCDHAAVKQAGAQVVPGYRKPKPARKGDYWRWAG
ncbi:MAG TPA: hypothetical protein VFU47_00585 [Armatimonadota bacterium]|nr:hypothetical protein [Armatimonadota bacterium]